MNTAAPTPRPQLVYLIFGSETYHQEAVFSIASALDDTRQVSAHLQRLMYKLITLVLPKHQQQFIREILYGCYEHPNEFDQACGPVWWDKARQNQEERQGRPIDASLLEHWFANPVVRLILDERREAIYEHLMKSSPK